MSADTPFQDLIARMRSGDQNAATELVRRYESVIRRTVRFRLVDTRLGAIFDSMDICQSVLGSFFVRAAAGQFDLDTPEELVKLLTTMARNKLASQARKEQADRRDRRRAVGGELVGEMPASEPSPSQQLMSAEMLQEVYRRLSPNELRLVELRNQGHDWAHIAQELDSDPVLLRKQFSRALDRVTREMGLEDADE